VYHRDPACQAPDDPSVRVWRYVDFTKFVALLATRRLHFATADAFDDPLEGSLPEPNARRARRSTVDVRRTVPISSWHLNQGESAAMWGLYLTSREGVALQTTFAGLCDAFREARERVIIGQVRYVDFRTDRIPERPPFQALLHKDKSYEYEREVRALLWDGAVRGDRTRRRKGMDVPVDLDLVAERVVIAPSAPSWFPALVRSVAERYGFDPERVVRSDLERAPAERAGKAPPRRTGARRKVPRSRLRG
jgi:hypothetical protein